MCVCDCPCVWADNGVRKRLLSSLPSHPPGMLRSSEVGDWRKEIILLKDVIRKLKVSLNYSYSGAEL